MGRQVRRVPLDFDWPIDELWSGYVLSDKLREAPCETCNRRGVTTARLWVSNIARLALMIDDDRAAQERGRDLHPYLAGAQCEAHGTRPSSDIAEFGTGLAGREAGWIGHDAINTWHATEALIKAAGLDPEVWGICPDCKGHGSTETYPGQRADADAWGPTDPPTGDGWQLWSTTTEGHPMTPVFPTAEALAEHCATANVSWFGHSTAPRAQWLASFIGDEIPGMVQVAPNAVIL